MVTHGFAASEMNSFSQWKDYYKTGTTESDSPPRFRRARRHRNSRRHLHRPLPTRFTNDFDLLQAILARQIVPANNCNADQVIHYCNIDTSRSENGEAADSGEPARAGCRGRGGGD